MTLRADHMLVGGTVITVDAERRIIRDGAVVIAGSDIVAVGKRESSRREYDAKTVRDCRHKLIMPGFVNSHLHFYHTMHRGLAPEDSGGVAVVELRAWQGRDQAHRRGRDLRRPDRFCSKRSRPAPPRSSRPARTIRAAAIEGVSRIGMRGLMGRRSFDQAILGHGC